MRKDLKIIGLPVCVATLLFATAPVSLAYTGEHYASQASVTLANARQIALKKQPGKITDQELEKEAGGSGLRYSFDIKSKGITHEVGVDAKTGKVLEDSVEGPEAD